MSKSDNIAQIKDHVEKGSLMQRIAINGFGRIGRNVLRAWFENPKDFQFEIVAINDVADVETLVHLFKHKSLLYQLHEMMLVIQLHSLN